MGGEGTEMSDVEIGWSILVGLVVVFVVVLYLDRKRML